MIGISTPVANFVYAKKYEDEVAKDRRKRGPTWLPVLIAKRHLFSPTARPVSLTTRYVPAGHGSGSSSSAAPTQTPAHGMCALVRLTTAWKSSA